MSERAIATREFAVTTEESALPYIVKADSKSAAREAIESQHLRVMWVEHRRSQCDKCKQWAQASTVKTQAGVTFCASCQSNFVDWVATAATDKATARPWRTSEVANGDIDATYISPVNGRFRLALLESDNHANDAEFIVRCVNSHDALVEAAKGVAIMLNTELERYENEPWAQRIRAALATATDKG